jgi:histone-lysine N-methyltransferase MLL1
MGKFPGKPSKIVNRKRVNASKCSPYQENDSIKAAENIYFGLAVFNETFGSEQVGLQLVWHEAIRLQRF